MACTGEQGGEVNSAGMDDIILLAGTQDLENKDSSCPSPRKKQALRLSIPVTRL